MSPLGASLSPEIKDPKFLGLLEKSNHNFFKGLNKELLFSMGLSFHTLSLLILLNITKGVMNISRQSFPIPIQISWSWQVAIGPPRWPGRTRLVLQRHHLGNQHCFHFLLVSCSSCLGVLLISCFVDFFFKETVS